MRLRRRLEAYAEHRLSPDLTATSRMRARVLAHAHRQADSCGPMPAPDDRPPTASITDGQRRVGRTARRVGVALVAAASSRRRHGRRRGRGRLAQARPSTKPRLWVETVTLPTDPSARAVAELDRLTERPPRGRGRDAQRRSAAAAAALAAYARIVSRASAEVVHAGDPVAAAALRDRRRQERRGAPAAIQRLPARRRGYRSRRPSAPSSARSDRRSRCPQADRRPVDGPRPRPAATPTAMQRWPQVPAAWRYAATRPRPTQRRRQPASRSHPEADQDPRAATGCDAEADPDARPERSRPAKPGRRQAPPHDPPSGTRERRRRPLRGRRRLPVTRCGPGSSSTCSGPGPAYTDRRGGGARRT